MQSISSPGAPRSRADSGQQDSPPPSPRLAADEPENAVPGDALAHDLAEIATGLVRSDPELAVVAAALEELRDRLQEGRFHLAVVGQFKRGKSSLLNALLREEVLPAAVVPLTAVPTFLRFGDRRRVRIAYRDERPCEDLPAATAEEVRGILERFVSEEKNPHNRLGVAGAEVFHPAAILAGGVVLIDTPGIGSSYRHNTEAALSFLSQCDAAMFLVSADPPITEVELEFLREVRRRVPRLFYLLNKIDYLSAEEQATAVEFFRRALGEVGVEAEAPVFALSARQGLAAGRSGETGLWQSSGLAAIESHLIGFLAREKCQALRGAVAQRARELAEEGLLRLRLVARSLELPAAELAERMGLLGRKLAEARREKEVVRDLLQGGRRRVVETLEDQAEALRREARDFLLGVAAEAGGAGGIDGRHAAGLLAEAIPGFFERRLGDVGRTFEERVREELEPHRRRAEELIETVFRGAAELFEVPYRAWADEVRLEVEHAPYWVTEKWESTLIPIPPGLIDGLLPRRWRETRRRRRLDEEVEALVRRNVENLRWATLQNLQLTLARFSSRLDERLELAVSVTDGALRTAATRRRERTAEVAADRAALAVAIARIEEHARRLGEGGTLKGTADGPDVHSHRRSGR